MNFKHIFHFKSHAYRMGLFLVFCLSTGAAQSQTVSGTVSADDAPLPGVSVVVKGTNNGTVTDFDGLYTINAESNAILVFSYIGFKEREIAVSGKQTVNVIMQEDVSALEEVVVIGYGAQKKKELTGAVAQVKSEELLKTATSDIGAALQGQIAGVNVTSSSGAPGAEANVMIRGLTSINGANRPLYVVDGIPFDGDPKLSINEIETIDVLKDGASAAIYGTRGAAGVILITTKKGKEGQMKIAIDSYYGLQHITSATPLLNVEDKLYVQFLQGAALNNSSYGNTWTTIEQSPHFLTNNTDLVNVIQNDMAPVQNHSLTLSGGKDGLTYNVTGNYFDQEGVIIGSQFKRGGLRTNLSYEVNKRVRVSGNLAVTRSQNSLVRTSTNTTQTSGGIIRSVLNYTPIRALSKNEDGALEIVGANSEDDRFEDPTFFQLYGANPLRYTDEVTESHNFTRVIGGVNTTIDLFAGIKADFRLAANYIDRKNNSYYPRTVSEGFGLNGLAVVSSNEFLNLINENLLRYDNQFGLSRVEALVGYTYETNRDYWINNEARDFPDDVLGYFALQNGLSHVPTRTNTATWKLASYLGRLNYIFNEKYLLTATFRRDGSSKFAANNKWAPFYSFALAWRLSQEPFIQNIEAISSMKLRLSYGESGNQAISPYQSLATIQGVSTSFNNQLVSGAIEGRLENENLRWETTSQINLGFDVELWNGRLFSTFNYYQKQTEDLLQQITLAPNTGFTNALINAGSIENKGYEIELGALPVKGALIWEVNGNISVNRNQIIELGEVEEQFADRLGAGNGLAVFPFIQKPGVPIGAIYGYEEDGIFQNEEEVAAFIDAQSDAAVGQIKYKDNNNDGVITDEDRTIIGDTNPDFIWGISNNFSWKGFDMSFLFQGVVGADIINTLSIRFHNLDGRRNIPVSVYESAWDGEGSSDNFRQINLNNGNTRFSDRYIEDGTYVRFKNIQLGYTFNAANLEWMSNARLYINAVNLWTQTDYTGYDPEVSAFSSAAMRGVDLGNYPQARTFIFGCNLTF